MTIIIAEAGVNHNGCEKTAMQLIDVAHEAGADIVKFQTFKASELVTHNAKKAEYQIHNSKIDESQFSMLSRLELSKNSHRKLAAHCNKLGIEFLSTAFDSDSLNFLISNFKLNHLKIPSGDITNAPLILKHAETGKDIILSTGMSTLGEIENALGVIAFGYIGKHGLMPSAKAFQSAYFSELGRELITQKVTLMHCTSEYPAPNKDINLNAIETLKASFKTKVGYSDHSIGIIVPIAAVAKGATIIEKHFTLDKSMTGPDHKASLDPRELKTMVQSIRDLESTFGNGLKGPQPSEIKNIDIARKSIIANRDIKKGSMICSEDLVVKRPGHGMSPFNYWNISGKISSKNYKEGELIEE